MKLRQILRIISIIIISCTILLAGILALPRLFGIVPYTVRTGSMEPAIPAGSLVYVDTNSKTAQVNDVIAFSMANGIIVTHRVVAKQDETYTTKGDANTAEDIAPVSASQVLGICVFHVPFVGYLFLIPAIKYLWYALIAGAMICLSIIRKERTPLS